MNSPTENQVSEKFTIGNYRRLARSQNMLARRVAALGLIDSEKAEGERTVIGQIQRNRGGTGAGTNDSNLPRWL